MHDLLIKNATVNDGSGTDGFVADVAVSQGKIDFIGHIQASALQVLDATGLALMPGVIDSHTHMDAQITWDSSLRPLPALGVTTVVMGNCGFCVAPCKPEHRDLTMRHLT